MLTEMMCAMGMTVTFTGEPVNCPKPEATAPAAISQPAQSQGQATGNAAQQRRQALQGDARQPQPAAATRQASAAVGDSNTRAAIARGSEPPGGKTRTIVPFPSTQYEAGTIVVRNGERALYFVRGDGTALRYKIAVGRQAMQWKGDQKVIDMQKSPAWSPPAIIRAAQPNLPDVIPGGAPNNPMGAAAIVLGDEYAIHGTNRPEKIGQAVSYGCFRMHNADILDLYGRVSLGTKVVALP
jgi:lipoprotein-anchoring transpeptidase ErfK/SrfK